MPYDQGYYAQLQLPLQGEYWFNDGGPTGNFPIAQPFIEFTAYLTGSKVLLNWYSCIDTAVVNYVLERSVDSINYTQITDTASGHKVPAGVYGVIDEFPPLTNPYIYYRLKWKINGNNNWFYAPVRKVIAAQLNDYYLSLGSRQLSHTDAKVNWYSGLDATADHYTLTRSINNGTYTVLATFPSEKKYSGSYVFTDQPAGTDGTMLSNGDSVHYKVSAYLIDGTEIDAQESSISWVKNLSIINVSPNPTADGNFAVWFSADSGTQAQIVITDVDGRRLYETSFAAQQFINFADLNISTARAGIYFVAMDLGGKKYVTRIVKQ